MALTHFTEDGAVGDGGEKWDIKTLCKALAGLGRDGAVVVTLQMCGRFAFVVSARCLFAFMFLNV